MRALVAVMDGEPVGIIGLAREPLAMRFFSEFKPELQPYLRSIKIMRGIKKAMQHVKASPGFVYAVAKHDEGKRILTRLGFVDTGEIFIWPSLLS